MFYMDHPNANENYSEFIGKELVKITRRMFPLSHKKKIHLSPGYLWEDTVQSEMV